MDPKIVEAALQRLMMVAVSEPPADVDPQQVAQTVVLLADAVLALFVSLAPAPAQAEDTAVGYL
jgi:hypothetical protein